MIPAYDPEDEADAADDTLVVAVGRALLRAVRLRMAYGAMLVPGCYDGPGALEAAQAARAAWVAAERGLCDAVAAALAATGEVDK